MRVRKGSKYRYKPAVLDRVDPRTNLRDGELVKVIQLPGAPPPNTMGHAHVERVSDGKFAGLVQTASLVQP